MLKLYKVKRVENTIKITTDTIEFDFFRYNESIYKDTIKAVYILKILVNFISIEELQFNDIIYNKFNRIIIIKSIR